MKLISLILVPIDLVPFFTSILRRWLFYGALRFRLFGRQLKNAKTTTEDPAFRKENAVKKTIGTNFKY
jgi:hypothetical protein